MLHSIILCQTMACKTKFTVFTRLDSLVANICCSRISAAPHIDNTGGHDFCCFNFEDDFRITLGR